MEKGIPTTPPQQLSTPRRSTKVNLGTRKGRETAAAPPATSQPAPPKARASRAKTTSVPHTITQPTHSARPPPKKRGQSSKVSKATQSTNEDVNGEARPVLEAPPNPTEEDTSQAEQLVPRENPSLTPLAPNSSSPSVHAQTSLQCDAFFPPGAPSPQDVEPVAKVVVEAHIVSESEEGPAQKEPGLFEIESSLSQPHSPGVLETSLKDMLKDIIHDMAPVFLALIRNHPEIKGNASFEHLLTDGEISVPLNPPNRKRKARLASQPVDQDTKDSEDARKPEKQAPEPTSRSASKRKALEIDQEDIENTSPKRLRVSLERTKRVPILFDKNGMLSLRAYKEVPVEVGSLSDEEVADKSVKPLDGVFSQDQQPQRPLETPRSRGWALSGLLPSAQTVTKYLPSFSRRTAAVAPASSSTEPNLHDPPLTPIPNATSRPQGKDSPITALHIRNEDRPSRSEPRLVTGDGDRGHYREHQLSTTAGASRRHRHSKSKHGLKTKGEKEEIRKRDELIASLRAQLEAQNESQAQKEAQAEKAVQAQLEMSAQIEAEEQNAAQQISDQTSDQTSQKGLKRKAESPKEIPNPPGGGFGMVLDYFGQDSDDDDDDDGDAMMREMNGQVTPTKPRKKSRLSGGPTPAIIGSPFRATPYTGTALALPPLPTEPVHSHEMFIDTNMDADTEGHLPISTDTPPNGPTITFTVPSPSDSDSEGDDPSYVEVSGKSSATPFTRASALNHNDSRPQTSALSATGDQLRPAGPIPKQSSPMKSNVFEQSETMPAPSNLNSQTTNVPLFPSTWTAPSSSQAFQVPSAPMLPNVALDKARQTALKHKPQQPSRLRESSRLSTSTIGTEADGDEAASSIVEKNPPKSNIAVASVHNGQDEHLNREGLEGFYSNSDDSKERQYFQGSESRDPYAGRLKRQSTYDPMLPEPVSIPRESSPPFEDNPNTNGEDSTDNTASDVDLPEDVPIFNSYGAFEKTLTPRVREHLSRQWGNEKGISETEATLASKLCNEACTVITEQFNEYEKQLDDAAEESQVEEVPEAMHDYIESIWDATDTQAAIEKFDKDFETWLNQPT